MPATYYPLILALVAAIVSGLIGSFALMKRMTLSGDATSHIALPGLGIALLLGINPILGGAAALLFGAVLIWRLEKRTGLATETAVGVIFSTSLAIGALIASDEELIDALFGGFGSMGLKEFLAYLVIAILITGFVLKFKNQLVVSLFSQDLALTTGINVSRLNLYYLLAFSLTIVLDLRLLGALLAGALIIIPAAVSRQLTHQFKTFLLTSSLVSAGAVLLGIWVSSRYKLELGPVVITIAAVFFVLSLLKKKR